MHFFGEAPLASPGLQPGDASASASAPGGGSPRAPRPAGCQLSPHSRLCGGGLTRGGGGFREFTGRGQNLVLSDTNPDRFESCHCRLLAMRIGEITPQGLVFHILKSCKDDGSTVLGGRHPERPVTLLFRGSLRMPVRQLDFEGFLRQMWSSRVPCELPRELMEPRMALPLKQAFLGSRGCEEAPQGALPKRALNSC